MISSLKVGLCFPAGRSLEFLIRRVRKISCQKFPPGDHKYLLVWDGADILLEDKVSNSVPLSWSVFQICCGYLQSHFFLLKYCGTFIKILNTPQTRLLGALCNQVSLGTFPCCFYIFVCIIVFVPCREGCCESHFAENRYVSFSDCQLEPQAEFASFPVAGNALKISSLCNALPKPEK